MNIAFSVPSNRREGVLETCLSDVLRRVYKDPPLALIQALRAWMTWV
jgi:hypothetical protein